MFGYKDVLEAGEAIAGQAHDITVGQMLQDLPDQEQPGWWHSVIQCIETVEADSVRSEFFIMMPDHIGDDVDSIIYDLWVLLTDLLTYMEVTTADVGDGTDVVGRYIFCYELDVLAAGFVIRA